MHLADGKPVSSTGSSHCWSTSRTPRRDWPRYSGTWRDTRPRYRTDTSDRICRHRHPAGNGPERHLEEYACELGSQVVVYAEAEDGPQDARVCNSRNRSRSSSSTLSTYRTPEPSSGGRLMASSACASTSRQLSYSTSKPLSDRRSGDLGGRSFCGWFATFSVAW